MGILMSYYTVTPNMNLLEPTVGSEAGPQYAIDINSSLTLIDQHDHSSGKGVQITPAGINITSNLAFNGNAAISLGYEAFNASASATTTFQAISVAPAASINELWYTDSNGTSTQITKNGVINATASSIPGESYNSGTGTFIWTQGTGSTTPANFDIGSVILRPNTVGTTNGITLSPSSTSSYTLTFAASLPSSTSVVTVDTSGNVGFSTPATSLMVTGGVVMYAGSTIPSGWLSCNGAAVSRSTYANLFSAIGTTYGSGDGSTTFNLPNTQGIFVRGAGSQTLNLTTYTGTLGAYQNDEFASHTHTAQTYTMTSTAAIAFVNSSNINALFNAVTGGGGYTSNNNNGISSTGIGTETKPANVCMNYIIKT